MWLSASNSEHVFQMALSSALFEELVQRFITAITLGSIAVICLSFWPTTLACIVSALALDEYTIMTQQVQTASGSQNWTTPYTHRIWNVATAVLTCGAARYGHQVMTAATVLLALLHAGMAITRMEQSGCKTVSSTDANEKSALLRNVHGSSVFFPQLAVQIFGLVYVEFFFAHALLLGTPAFLMIKNADNVPWAPRMVFIVIASTIVGENAALVIGKLLGRKHITPVLSPKKTLEGYIAQPLGSCIFLFVLSKYTSWLLPLNSLEATIFGLLHGVCGVFGDLLESFIKRTYHTKDSNALLKLPGTGGILDRIDGLLFNFPVSYYFFQMRHFWV